MKQLSIYCTIALSLLMFSCKKENVQPVNDRNEVAFSRGAGGSSDGTELPSTTATMYAAQNIDAGTITISNDSNFIYVTYNITNGYTLDQIHLYAGATSGIPVNNNGNVQPGQFPYAVTLGSGVTSYTYAIPVSTLSSIGGCGSIAAHASLSKRDAYGNIIEQQSAWSAGPRISTRGNWATQTPYCLL